MSKQKLLLSVAAGALLALPTLADTTISSSTDKGLVTTSVSDLTDDFDTDYYTTGVGNIIITSSGSVARNKSDWSAITVNSDNYVYSNGLIQDNGKSDAYGIEIDMTDVASWNMASGGSFTNAAGSTISGSAIYLDSSSVIKLGSDSGTTKYGIWLNGAASSCLDDSGVSSCVVTGDITMVDGSQIFVRGTTGRGIYAEYGTELDGNVTIAGTIELHQLTATSTSSSGNYGMYMLGKIDGDVTVSSTGEVLSEGASSYGMFLSGSGITGALTIDGKVIAEGISSSSSDFSQTEADNGDTIYPEGAVALAVGSSIDGGIKITGTVQTLGTAEAIMISPSLSYGSASYDTVSSLIIGYYDTTTYGFYNSGTISVAPINANKSATAAIYLVGGGSQYPGVINGGIYNSGTISATVRNSTDSPTTVSATALLTSGYFYVGGYAYTVENTTTGTVKTVYTADTVSSCSTYSSGYCYDDGTGTISDASARGSLVNTGTISAVASSGNSGSVKIGTGAASVRAIFIASDSHLTSIVNSGTILASATVRSDYTDDVTSLSATAITDYSGTLTYIYNTGLIEALVTSLDNDAQSNIAIYLSGDATSESGDGVTIISKSTSSSSAYIVGDIYFGDGDNQQIYVEGNSSHYSYLYGDISFGASTLPGASNGDLLSVGAYSVVSGIVTATNDVAVAIYNKGTLNLQNDTTSLNASTLTVYSGGTLNIGASRDMDDTGSIDVSDYAVINSGATLGVTYNSYAPSGNGTYLLIRTEAGKLYSSYDTSTATGTALTTADLTSYNTTIANDLPFLFNSASLSVTSDTKTSSSGSTKAYDEVVLTVDVKDTSELGLTGYAKQMFSYINTALDVDPDLGAAMVNDIGDGCGTITDGACTGSITLAEAYSQAQKAFNAFAPNMTGASRQVAISLTDQATGVVGARQRALRDAAKDGSGDLTLWGQFFGSNIKADGQGEVGADGSYAKNGYKEKGYGFALGVDEGSPRFGWYGGAITVYNSSVREVGRDSHDNELWVLLSGYSTWRGKHLFFDSKIDAGYGRIRGKRFISLSDTDGNTYDRESDSKHAAELLSGGFTTGAVFDYAGFTITPQFSLDGMVMRMEGYRETNPDSTVADEQGFLLHVYPGYYRSLRGYVGTSLRYDFNLFGLTWQPEAHGGYRYDFMHDQVKSDVSFKDIDTELTGDQAGERFTLTGLDPARSNLVGGASFGFKTDGWSLNASFDLVHGNNGMTQKIGTLNFMVRL